ncbi:cytochrome P450 [soil metagenome]
MTTTAKPDFLSAEFKSNPYTFYAHLREHAPVYPGPKLRGQQAWLVTRYDDVAQVLKDGAFAKDVRNAWTLEQLKKAPWLPPPFRPLQNNLLSLDPPDHTRLRALAHQAFTPRMVERMRNQTRTLAHELLDEMEGKGGTLDLIESFALPLPITIIGRILGVPERDNAKFRRWTNAFVSLGSGRGVVFKMPAVLQFIRYLRGLIQQRTEVPQDDLVSALVLAREEDASLTEDEVLAMTFLLLSAGHETTVNLIASGTLALLEHPEQWRRLQEEPSLIKSGVEELLRFVTPAETSTERFARADVEVAGTIISKGALVLGVIASANRDPRRFENPETVDVARADNKHLAFGQGIHYCVGAPLSRLESEVAFTALTERLPDLRLGVPPEKLKWRSNLVLRGLKALPVSF